MIRFPLKGILAIALILLLPACDFHQNADDKDVLENNNADDFALLDQDGQFHQLYYYSDKKAIVIISQANGSPFTRKSIPYLRALKQFFEPQGVLFWMINANPQDDRASIKKESVDYNIDMPILQDRSQVITESLGITRTAEAVVIDPTSRKMVYRGAINSELSFAGMTWGIGHQYLKDALNKLLQCQPIDPSETMAMGEPVNFIGSPKVPSYNNDVVPILAAKCIQCHVKGGIAPWSMDDYNKVHGWSAMIREVLRTGRMPPWQADPHYGKFKEDLSLSPGELRTLVHWVEAGSPNDQGQDSLIHVSRPDPNGWVLGQPDLIFELKDKQQILPSGGSDQFRFIEADKPVDRDLWVRGIYWRPGNLKILHHGNLIVEMPSQGGFDKDWFHNSGMDMETGQIVDGYSPGSGPFILPEGTGFYIPKGARLFFRMHYIADGRVEQDNTQIGLYLYKNRPTHALSVSIMLNRALSIPPGAKGYPMAASYVFKDNVTLYALQPHMHYRGHSMRFVVEYPDGRQETLLSVPNYKFRWQHRYILKEPKKLPAGSRIFILGEYDNSAQNLDNPDPTKRVVYGPLSSDEMFVGILYFVEEPLNRP